MSLTGGKKTLQRDGSPDRRAERRGRNARALGLAGLAERESQAGSPCQIVRDGAGPVVYTVGYEKRSGDELISCLLDSGVNLLIDIRRRPVSRKPDFRQRALAARCHDAGVGYQSWTDLGSTDEQRDRLKETGDFAGFARRFRAYARDHLGDSMARLAAMVEQPGVTAALLCYERCHDACHRSIVAALLADRTDARILAIV